MRACKKCGQVKALDEYYKAKSGRDGRRIICKKCVSSRAKIYYHANANKSPAVRESKREAWRAQSRKHYEGNAKKVNQRAQIYRAANSDQLAADAREYRRRNKAMTKAHSAINCAKKSGRLEPSKGCWHCGKAPTEAHHSSYAEDMRLAVTWLCGSCHRTVHSEHSRR